MERIVAIVPAAGAGRRFGKNKPLHLLLDKPLIVWSLQILEGIEEIGEILPVAKEEDLQVVADMIDNFCISKVRRIVPGGKERQDSVYNALRLLDDKTSVVMIHDGVRPLAEKDIIRRSLEALKGVDGVVAGVPVKDTIKEVSRQQSAVGSRQSDKKELIVQKTLNRDVLWAVQTPQVFQYEKIRDAYEMAYGENYYATDDAALLERYGGRVKVIMGSYRNIKITTPEDISIAEALLKLND